MKKRCMFVVLPLALCSLFLSSCQGNPYAGNYTEVEDKTAVSEKLNALAAEGETAEEKKTNYESTLQGKLTMSFSASTISYTANYEMSSYLLVDTTKDSEGTYTKLTIKGSASGGESASVNGSIEAWTLKDAAYCNYNFKAESAGNKTEYVGKKKTDSMPSELTPYLSLFSSFDTEFDAGSITSMLDEKGVKVYTAGDNKYKFELKEGSNEATVYLIINKDNTYQAKCEVPEQAVEMLGQKMTMSYSVEIKPTSKKVTAPADAAKYE